MLSWRNLRGIHFGIICDSYRLSHYLWLKAYKLKMKNQRWSDLVQCLFCLLNQKCSSKLSPNQNSVNFPLSSTLMGVCCVHLILLSITEWPKKVHPQKSNAANCVFFPAPSTQVFHLHEQSQVAPQEAASQGLSHITVMHFHGLVLHSLLMKDTTDSPSGSFSIMGSHLLKINNSRRVSKVNEATATSFFYLPQTYEEIAKRNQSC